MKGMKRVFKEAAAALRRMLLINKRLLKKPGFIAFLCLIPLLAGAASHMAQLDSGVLTIALACEDPDDATANDIIESLEKGSQMLRFVRCGQPDKAKELVYGGRADAAWIFHADMRAAVDRYVRNRVPSSAAVTVIEREESAALALTREKLCSALYPYASYSLYLLCLEELGVDTDALSEKQLREYYAGSDVDADMFEVVYPDGERLSAGGDERTTDGDSVSDGGENTDTGIQGVKAADGEQGEGRADGQSGKTMDKNAGDKDSAGGQSGEAADGARDKDSAGGHESKTAGSAAASSEAARESYLVSPVRGILAACVVAAGLASAMYLGDDMSAGRFAWLAKRRRAFVPAAYIFGAAIDTTVIMCLSLAVFGLSSGFAREVSCGAAFAFASAAFCIFVRELLPNNKLLAAALPVLSTSSLVLCPVFLNFTAVRPLSLCLPGYYYLLSFRDIKYLHFMLLYAAAALAAAASVHALRALLLRRLKSRES